MLQFFFGKKIRIIARHVTHVSNSAEILSVL